MADKELSNIIVLEPVTDAVRELLKIIGERKQAELTTVSSADEAWQLVTQYMPCMLVVCINENPDIPVIVNLLKKSEKIIKKGMVKTLCVSKIKNKQLGNLISSLGVTDFMEEPVPVRTMQFKANLQIKAIETIKKQSSMKKASEETMVFKPSEKKKEEDPNLKKNDANAKLAPALNVAEDTFLFKNSGVKKNGKKITVELEGPAPETGEWVQHEDKGDAKTSWRWIPEEKMDAPETKNGDGWVHEGDKPIFKNESKKWQLTGEKPELALHKDGQKIAKKISVDKNGEVTVASDSEKAIENIKKNEVSAKKKRENIEKIKKEAKEKPKNLAEEKENTLVGLKKDPGGAQLDDSKEKDLKKSTHAEDPINRSKPNQIESKVEENSTLNRTLENQKKLDEKASGAVKAIKKSGEEKVSNEKKPPLSIEEEKNDKAKANISALDFLQKKKAEKSIPEKIEDESETAIKSQKIKNESSDEKNAQEKRAAGASRIDNLKSRLGEELKEDSIEEEPSENLYENKKNKNSSVSEEEQTPNEEAKAASAEKEKTYTKTTPLEKSAVEKKIAEQKEKEEANKAKRKKIQRELQAELNRALPDKISQEEETALRKELGLENKKELTASEILKRARLEKIKSLKKQLADFDLEMQGLDEEGHDPKVHDLRPDELDNTWSQKGEEFVKDRKKIRAFDSELSDEEIEEREKIKKKREKDEAAARALGLKSDSDTHFLPEASVLPLGGAWESTGEYCVFLSGEIRYHGFEKLVDILPLWIFQGTGIPELLDKSKEWKFIGAIPFQAKEIKEIPEEVRDYLLALRDEKNESENIAIEEKKGNKKNIEQASIENEQDRDVRKNAQATNESNNNEVSEDNTLVGTSTQNDKKPRDIIADRLSAINSNYEKERLKKEFEFTEEIESSSGAKKKTIAEEESDSTTQSKKNKKDALDDKYKNLSSSLDQEAEKLEKAMQGLEGDVHEPNDEQNSNESIGDDSSSEINESIEKEKEARKKKRDAESFQSKLDSLKNNLASTENSDSESTEKDISHSKQDKSKLQNSTEEEKTKEKSTSITEISEKLSKKSKSISNFLERRKNKKESPSTSQETSTKKIDSNSSSEAKKTEKHSNPYLGIFVVLSDAINIRRDPQKAILQTLRAIEDSMEHTIALILEPNSIEGHSSVIFSNRENYPSGFKVSLDAGTLFPITKGVEPSTETLAYLFAQSLPPKTGFDIAQNETLTRASKMLGPIFVRTQTGKAERSAA